MRSVTEARDHGEMTTPNPALARAAGLVMVVGVVFLILGSDPVVDDVFGTSDVDARLRAIEASPDAWDRAWSWFALAIIPIAVGFMLWAAAVRLGGSERRSTMLADVGAAASFVGSLIWIYLCYARATHAPADVAADPNITWWTPMFVPLVILALLLLGVVARRAGLVKRGWAIVALAVVAVPICLVLPLLVPIVVTLAGIAVALTRSDSWAGATGPDTPPTATS